MTDEWKILNDKLNLLIREQERFQTEIRDLKNRIDQLKPVENVLPVIGVIEQATIVQEPIHEETTPLAQMQLIPQIPTASPEVNVESNQKWERFIGENLISKIGISILILGVAIGAKFAIDHELISPLTRIVLGYLLGFGLLAFSIKLKEKYHQFSAVLLSGSMAINYFLTYAAYSLYDLFPQYIAFLLMVIFTIFTVLASLQYNLQLIAHIGLVGAYAVPFLLSDGSGKVFILFSYMAIINVGILFIAYKRFWKHLYHLTYVLTWLIFASWFIFSYEYEIHQWMAFGFASIFYVTFYGMFLVYKLLVNEKFEPGHVLLILSNSFIYFGFGYSILNSSYTTNDFLGLFTILNALIHFVVSYYIKKRDLADKDLFVVIISLVLVFVSIAIPIQLDGNWVTLSWAAEAALLFWVGRTRTIFVYEALSYAVMVLFFFSILQDWGLMQNQIKAGQDLVPLLFNRFFLVSILSTLIFGFINYVHLQHESNQIKTKEYILLCDLLVSGILMLVGFLGFAMEIVNYWNTLMYNYQTSHTDVQVNSILNPMIDALRFKNIWLINYSALFFILLVFTDLKFNFRRGFKYFVSAGASLVCLLFLFVSLFEFSELREAYLMRFMPSNHVYLPFSLSIRYISFAFVFPLLYMLLRHLDSAWFPENYSWVPGIFKHFFILWILSSEMLHIMDVLSIEGSYKLSLSILWGVYALFLVFIGISQTNKYLRYSAIALFAFTLLKLFFYDISGLNTIGKTIVFVSLGILLLIISFLYNKNKSNLFDEQKEE